MTQDWLSLENWPLGEFTFAADSTARTSSSPRPRLFSSDGFTSTRTPGNALPPTNTWPTPGTCEILCCKMVEAASYIWPGVMVVEIRPSWIIGASAGLTLRQNGFLGRFVGSCPRAALMAAWTSRAAASILRFRSNWRVMFVVPRLLDEVISLIPAIRPNWRSSGVATDDAMVSGLAPGNWVETWIEGKSTCGSGPWGRKL